MRVLELPRRLAYWGVPYRLVAGWEGRGNDFPVRPDGALRHWVGAWGAGLRTVTYGRSDLPGPLCNTNQTREVDPRTGLDVVNVVASGKANHAGAGVLNGIIGNYKLLGLEIDWAGPSEAFGPMRKLTSELVMRAMLDCCAGTDTNDVGEHREYARPSGRKIDTNLSGDELRHRMRTIQPFRPGDDFLSALTDQEQRDLRDRVKTMFDVFASPTPNNGPGDPTSRVSKVLDNAMWTAERIKVAHDEARNAALAAGECNRKLAAIVEHLGIEIPDPPKS